jgi:hypothetical protein
MHMRLFFITPFANVLCDYILLLDNYIHPSRYAVTNHYIEYKAAPLTAYQVMGLLSHLFMAYFK